MQIIYIIVQNKVVITHQTAGCSDSEISRLCVQSWVYFQNIFAVCFFFLSFQWRINTPKNKGVVKETLDWRFHFGFRELTRRCWFCNYKVHLWLYKTKQHYHTLRCSSYNIDILIICLYKYRKCICMLNCASRCPFHTYREKKMCGI